jgi:thioredoxin 1
MIAPIVEELAGEYEGKLSVRKLDVDENGAIAARYSIMSIPTLGIFRGGELIERIVGYMPKEQLKRRIDAALASSRV